MTSARLCLIALPLMALGGCVTTTPAPRPSAVLVTPTQPAAVWQPGHWVYTGTSLNPWTWVPGQYVTSPVG
jgi:hypothetical protein